MRVFLFLLPILFFAGILASAEAQYFGETQYYTKLKLNPIKSQLKQNDVVTFSGQLTANNGEYVIQQATIHIKNKYDKNDLTTLITDMNGKFSGKWKVNVESSGSLSLYATYDGDDGITSAKSKTYNTYVTKKSTSQSYSHSGSSERGTYDNPNYQNKKSVNQYLGQQESSYSIYIDPLPSWATYAGNVMYDSTKMWEGANPGMKFYKASSPSNANFVVKWVKEFGVEHVGYAYGQQFVEVGLGDSNCNGKWQPYSPYYSAFIMAHEIGHILGHEHNNDPNSLMYPVALNREYAIEEQEFTLTKNYAQFVGLCTVKDMASYEYSVSSIDGKSGFDVYFVPSADELDKWSRDQSFSHYNTNGCFGKGYISYNGACNGVSRQGGLLIIMDDNAAPLAKIKVQLLEK